MPVQLKGKIDARQLGKLRAAGMTHIRLPIVGENFMARFSGSATIDYTIGVLGETLDRLLALGFSVSVDMHPADEFAKLMRENPAGAFRELQSAWVKIAPTIRARDAARVFAELLNEPTTSDEIWRPAVERLVRYLRQSMPDTMFIVGPAPYQRVEALAKWQPLQDSNLIYAFHYYDPMAFTHQGQTWLKNDPLSRLAAFPFPARHGDARTEKVLAAIRARDDKQLLSTIEETVQQPWDEKRIRTQFSTLKAWRDTHNVPVILNEFGVLRFKSPRKDRLLWLATVRRAAEDAGFGWVHWDYSGGFGLVSKNGSIDRGVLKALTGQRETIKHSRK